MPDRTCPVCRLIVSQYEPARVLVEGHWYHMDCRRTADRTELVTELMADIAAGLRVLRTRDELPLSEAQIEERARNVVAGLVENYRIERLAAGQSEGGL